MRIYRASSLGGCIKAQVAEKIGMVGLSTEKQMKDLGREGNLHEGEVVTRMKHPVFNQQMEVNLQLLPEVIVQGHIDGMTDYDDSFLPYTLEIKSMGADPYKAWMKTRWDTPGLVQKYKWQVSAYMLATELPLLFAVKNRNTGKLDISTVEEPFYSKSDILARVLEIERWVRMGELPDECSVVMFPCAYYYLHDQTSLELTEDEAMDALGVAYDEARQAVKKAESRRDETRKALDAGLAGRDRVSTKRVVVGYNETSRSVTDYERMKEDGVYEKYVKVEKGKVLQVTVKKDKEDGNG